jgi:anti-sigma factor RsiW
MGLTAPHPRDELLGWVEKRLSPADQRRVGQHVAGCAACQAEAADLLRLNESLSALPAALRGLASPSGKSWSGVWARVQGVPVRRWGAQLNLGLSLAVIFFVIAAAFPAGLANEPVSVTVGAAQTPAAVQTTPAASTVAAPDPLEASTALAVNQRATGARALPVPTPIPGLKG